MSYSVIPVERDNQITGIALSYILLHTIPAGTGMNDNEDHTQLVFRLYLYIGTRDIPVKGV